MSRYPEWVTLKVSTAVTLQSLIEICDACGADVWISIKPQVQDESDEPVNPIPMGLKREP